MCSIHGVIGPDRALLGELLRAGAVRGRDAWGWAASDGAATRELGESRGAADPPPGGGWVVANCRAEPTTEWLRRPAAEDVQPYTRGAVTVVHNGTVANDRDLAEELRVTLSSGVDSEVLAFLLDDGPWELGALAGALERVQGSFAVAAGHRDHPDALFVAVNWRPLRLLRLEGGWAVTSLSPEQLGWDEHARHLVDLPPYTAAMLTPEGMSTVSLLPGAAEEHRTLAVCSGGMDSTVAATVAAQRGPTELLHLRYGCRAEGPELIAVHAVAEALGAPLRIVDLGDLFTGLSPLTRDGAEVAGGEAGAEFAYEWVPARNLVMMAVAVAVAEGHGFTRLTLGANMEEAGAYPDNEPEFTRRLAAVLPYATGPGVGGIAIDEPVGNLVKHEVVALGLQVGAPLDRTWSCYHAGDAHCGSCGPCYMRRTAYAMLNEEDPMRYLDGGGA